MISKKDRRDCWIDQIKTAKSMADKAIKENPADNGTCNFDSAMIKKEKWFTYDEIIQIFKDYGLPAHKHTKGWLLVGGVYGQAEKNTLWHKTFSFWLEEQGFETSMYYQID